MAEKGVENDVYVAHDEKKHTHDSPEPEEPGRRGSIALNIVENPLKVNIPNYQ